LTLDLRAGSGSLGGDPHDWIPSAS